ncbi:MAG: hypothetical protein HND56_04720 [Pseudomonadota bacterium]|nr:hypothetical protein [Pseudomonadota bacterium]QKK05035.1 MAG: hypothetical protein HND56_04720 [Pseudomonadota bacterium]
MAEEKPDTASLQDMEETLTEMFRGNASVYNDNTNIDNRKEFRRIAAELSHAILEVRRQRHLEEGNPQFVPETKPSAQRRYSAKRASNGK